MIDVILFHIYANDLFNNNQYGFTPQRGTIDVAMEVNNNYRRKSKIKTMHSYSLF